MQTLLVAGVAIVVLIALVALFAMRTGDDRPIGGSADPGRADHDARAMAEDEGGRRP